MASIDDFKLIKLKSKKMYDYLNLNLNISEIQKERFGFYHLILESITGEIETNLETNLDKIDLEEQKCFIIDTEYNKILYGRGDDDLGIDVVYLDDSKEDSNEIDIKLFNFKYRENFKTTSNNQINELTRSTEFLRYLDSSNEIEAKTIPEKLINKIISLLNSNYRCNFTMYLVSNQNDDGNNKKNKYIEMLETDYSMKVVYLKLDDIIKFFVKTKINSICKFIINEGDCFTYETNKKSTQKSYVLKMSLFELLRIFSKDKALTCDDDLKNEKLLKSSNLDLDLLYDNVRGYLGNTKYNKNIINTLEIANQEKMFFMYNNGITLIADDIVAKDFNRRKMSFEVKNYQIVNGGQTLRSIDVFFQRNNSEKSISKLKEAYILLRIFKIENDEELKNNIAEYTNSQNAISCIDLKSIDYKQIILETYLKEVGILYSRKAGDLGDIDFHYSYRISMVKLAQIIYSSIGYPDRATNQKKNLFSGYYDEIFINSEKFMDKCLKLINNFMEIEKAYSKKKFYEFYDQKGFYIIYIISNTKKSINSAMVTLEDALKNYPVDKESSEARKLIQKRFKLFLDEKLGITS